MSSNSTASPATRSPGAEAVKGVATWVDDRLSPAKSLRKNLSKVFPDHWSFMLGEIALYSFVILLLSGTYLTLFFKPSMVEVVYQGPYDLLRGVQMSEAYESTMSLSFEVRGGLLMRQIHHWAALLFLSAMFVHMMRIFFTGAFRKPREINWIIGVVLLLLGFTNGFTGYSLPDDLLSGTGLRVAQGIFQSIPVVGTYLSYLVFGGEFPGDDFIPRLYAVHILLIPGVILALVAAHIMILVYQKHTQYPGPGRTDRNVVGYPFFPVYTAKAGGFFFIVFGVTTLMSAFIQINPVWIFGPYNPSQVSAGTQPDWYVGWLDGALRIMPNLETRLWGFTLSWNVLIPGALLMGIFYGFLAAYPFIERWITGDNREHHVLERPRSQPTRTAIGVAGMTAYGVLWLAGANDVEAFFFHLSSASITWTFRVLVIIGPIIAFIITKRICLGLQRRDRDTLLHGRESGIIRRLPSGEFVEIHVPVTTEEAFKLSQYEEHRPLPALSATDANGVSARRSPLARARVGLSHWYFADHIAKPTRAELEAAWSHADGHHEIEAGGAHDAIAPPPDSAGVVETEHGAVPTRDSKRT